MNRTKIPWADYTINPVKGLCPAGCEYCYARKMYKRFKWNPAIRFEPEHLINLSVVPDGSRVFIGSTIELFHEYTIQWMPYILECIKKAPWQTSILLTKQPQNLRSFDFPDNCWVGVSVCNDKMLDVAVDKLEDVQAKTKFISFEPLLERLTLSLDYTCYYSGISWAIIGQQTPVRLKTMPEIGWIEEIVSACDKANIPVFLKDNLISCVDQYPFAFRGEFPDIKLRQEFPLRG